MTYSYTQISQYLRCPRSYRYRYLDGWREKDNRASLLFGRAFEKALAAFFAGEDSTAALFKEWGTLPERRSGVFARRQLGADVSARSAATGEAGAGQPHPDQPASARHAGQAGSLASGRERLRRLP